MSSQNEALRNIFLDLLMIIMVSMLAYVCYSIGYRNGQSDTANKFEIMINKTIKDSSIEQANKK